MGRNAVMERIGRRIRLGVIGGGGEALIGPVHRIAARIDDSFEIAAGILSLTLPDRGPRLRPSGFRAPIPTSPP